jgi:glycosyltransferase involved in cell wall biosynthesis
MRIGIDAHGAGGHSFGLGNETYSLNLIRGLLDIDQENEYHVFVDHPEHARHRLGDRPNLKLVTFAVRSQWFQRPISLPLYAHRHRLDVLHVPFVRPFFTDTRVVITVHDASYELMPGVYRRSESLRMKMLVPWSCGRADLVFTVSEYARTQIHECYSVPLEKIVVTYNAADHMSEARRRLPQSSGFDLPRPYLLYCGLIQPRKNIVRLVEAFDRFKTRTGLPHELVLAGKMGWHSEPLQRALVGLKHRDAIRFLGYVANPMPLAPLISGAEAFVFPSLFESFAIPVLEAQVMGVPALVADGSCFPEVFGDSVAYCDPLSVESIATAIERLVRDPALRAELSRRGTERATRYSWRCSAEVALEAYSHLAGGDPVALAGDAPGLEAS